MATFPPDSFLVAEVMPSANHDERKHARDMILLHYTGMQNGETALQWLCSPASKVSAHYVVFEDGRIVQCVPEERRAWHAGAASWAGETDINSCSIGIEIVNPGHELGYRNFPLRQVAAVISLCRSIVSRRGPIRPDRVLAHSDVAPARKQDPGEKFPWWLLAQSSIGNWVQPPPLDLDGDVVLLGDKGEAVERLQRMLADYGYAIEVTGNFDEATRAVVMAFQRHYRPARVDGVADPSTLLTLITLTERRQAPPLQAAPPAAEAAPGAAIVADAGSRQGA